MARQFAVVNSTDFQRHTTQHVADAEHGQRIVVTYHGKPLVALLPIADLERLERLEEMEARLVRMRDAVRRAG